MLLTKETRHEKKRRRCLQQRRRFCTNAFVDSLKGDAGGTRQRRVQYASRFSSAKETRKERVYFVSSLETRKKHVSNL
jgi:hypothetical protein